MKDALKIEVDEEMVCGIENHMKDIFTEALCTLLNHPRQCPHVTLFLKEGVVRMIDKNNDENDG